MKKVFYLLSKPIDNCIILIIGLLIMNIGCNNNDDFTNPINKSPSLIPNTITGIVDDEPIEGAEVYIEFSDGSTSIADITENNGYFQLDLTNEDLQKINPDITDGKDGLFENLLIIANKNGKFLRNAISRNVADGQIVYITNDTEAYSQFLESIGKFNTNALLDFNNELSKGRISENSRYYDFIKNIRESIKEYFLNGNNKPENSLIFAKAIDYLGKEHVSLLSDDSSLIESRDIMCGGDLVLPEGIRIESDDVSVIPINSNRYTIGANINEEIKAYLKVVDDDTYKLIPVNTKSKQISQIAKEIVTPQQGVIIENDSDVNIIIPPFALNQNEEITINKIVCDGTTSDGKILLDMLPSGLSFEMPITIKINYLKFGIENIDSSIWLYGTVDNGYEDANVVYHDNVNHIVYLNVDHFSSLLVKEISKNQFIDLANRFAIVVPRRNYLYVPNGDDAGGTSQTVIITNKIFKGTSTNNRYTSYGGGYCVQFARTFLWSYKLNATGLDTEKITSDSNYSYNDIYSGNAKQGMNRIGNNYDTYMKGYVRDDYSNIEELDLAWKSTKGTKNTVGHTYTVSKVDNDLIILESNASLSQDKIFNFTYQKGTNGISWGYRADFGKKLTKSKFVSQDDASQKYIDYTKDQFVILSHPPKRDKPTEKAKGILKKYMTVNEDESPYAYFLLSKVKDGVVKKNNGRYSYIPDLLPVSSLKIKFTGKDGNIESFEDSRYEIYAEDIEEKSEDFIPINFTTESKINLKKYHVRTNYPNGTFTGWLSRSELEVPLTDFVENGHNNTNKYWVDIYVDGEPYCGQFNDDFHTCDALGAEGLLDLADFKTEGYLKINDIDFGETLMNHRYFGNLKKLKSTDDSNISEFKMISSSKDNDWAKLEVGNIDNPIKILFSPTVIDDYYINWGEDNNNHDIPIGFWNKYGYEIENSNIETINIDNKDTITLTGKKVYKSDDALNGFFMTLNKDDSAEWHFSLSGKHAIFVHVPYKKRGWIENAEFQLKRKLENSINELVANLEISDISQKLPESSFNGWFVLYQKDAITNEDNSTKDKYGFDLNGHEYLEVKAEGGIVVVDAIRLQGRKSIIDDLLKLKGQVDLSDSNDIESVMIKLKGTNSETGEVLFEKIVDPNTNFTLEFSRDTDNFEIKTLITPVEPLTGAGSLNNRSYIKNNNEPVATLYKPQIQYIEVDSTDTTINLSKVVLQKLANKELVKIKVIDATNGVTIQDAIITVRFGIDRSDHSTAYTGTSGENGLFEIQNMPFGQYSFELQKEGYITTVLNLIVGTNTPETTDFSLSPELSESEMRIRLTWGLNPVDLDSHLVKRSGETQDYHIYFGSEIDEFTGDNLDLDDTTSYGPETITIKSLDLSSFYIYYVHKYLGEGRIADSEASVKISSGNKEVTYYPPSEDGTYWKVFTIENGLIQPCIENCMGSSEY